MPKKKMSRKFHADAGNAVRFPNPDGSFDTAEQRLKRLAAKKALETKKGTEPKK